MKPKVSYEIQVLAEGLFPGRRHWAIGSRSTILNSIRFQKEINQLKKARAEFKVVKVTEKVICTHKTLLRPFNGNPST